MRRDRGRETRWRNWARRRRSRRSRIKAKKEEEREGYALEGLRTEGRRRQDPGNRRLVRIKSTLRNANPFIQSIYSQYTVDDPLSLGIYDDDKN